MPCRDDEARRLLMMLDCNTINILRSAPKTGKTSLINTTLTKERLEDRGAAVVRFNVPKFRFGDKVLDKQLVAIINSICDKPTYLDLAFEDDGSLWFASKKLQANYKDCKRFYFVFDDFDNYFTYGEAARREFAAALSRLAYGEVPVKFSDAIQNIMLGESDVPVSKEGVMLLIDAPKVSLLFVVSNAMYSSMSQLGESISNVFQNNMELQPFDVDTAKNAVALIASEPIDNLPPTSIEQPAIDYLVSHFASNGGTVNPGLLRNAVYYLRQEARGNDNITLPMVEVSEFFKISYFDEAMDAIGDDSRRNALISFALGEMMVEGESQPLPAYRGVAISDYGVGEDDLDYMVSHYVFNSKIGDDGRLYYMPFSGEVFTMLKQRGTGVETVKRPRPKIAAAAMSSMPENKKSARPHRSRLLLVAFAAVTLLSCAFGLLAFSLKDDVERNANAAKSNMLSAFAFQKIESDPTFSLRLAQQAIMLDSCNTQAYSALINSFYNTDIFYNITGDVFGNSKDNIVKAEISADGQLVYAYVCDFDNARYAVKMLRGNGNVFLEIPHKAVVTSVVMSSDGKRILTASQDSVARVFDLKGNLITQIDGHKAIIWAADFSPDGNKILTAGSDFKVMIWDLDGNCTATLKGHDSDVYCAVFSPDGEYVLSSSGDNTARLWTLDGKLRKELVIKEDNRFSMSIVSQAIFSPDGKYILLAANDGLNQNHKARLWDLDGNELVALGNHRDWINSVGFSPDGKHIITSSRDKVARVFSLNGTIEKELKGHSSNVWSARFKSDNKTIVSVSDDHTIRNWSIGRRVETYENAVNISFADFSQKGFKIIVVRDTIAQSWNMIGETVATFVGHRDSINTARFSPDGSMVLTAGKDGAAFLWSADGIPVKQFRKHQASVNDAIFTSDGKKVITISSDSTARVCNLETDSDVVLKTMDVFTSVCPSPEPNVFALGTNSGDIIIYDISGKELCKFHGHDGRVNSVVFSPDGKYLLSTSLDKTAVLWDNIGQMKYTFRGYANYFNSAVFSPDGKYIVTTSNDGFARMWTIDGKDIMDFEHDGIVKNAVFSPNGEYLLSVYQSKYGHKSLKVRIINPDGIIHQIDELDLYGNVWLPDSATMKKYGIE